MASKAVSKLVEIALDADGIEYVEQCLRRGMGLCRELLRLPVASGRVFAPIPRQKGLGRAKSFDEGGLMARRDTIAWLAKHALHSWDADPSGILVFQDIWASPSDPPVQISRQNRFVTESNVYYFLEKNADSSDLDRTLSALTSYLLIAVFTMIQSLVQLITGNEMRGRVMSVYNVAFRGGMPIGNLITGMLVPIFTAPIVLAVNGTLLFILGLYFLMVQRKVAEL